MAAKKKVTAKVKLQIKAGMANPSPPVGTALGPHAVNIAGFCRDFNERTKTLEKGIKVTVEITIYKDKSLDFILKGSPAAVLILKALQLEKGSGTPNAEKVGKLTQAQLKAIAQAKLPDLNAVNLEAAMRTVAGTARSMGIEVE